MFASELEAAIGHFMEETSNMFVAHVAVSKKMQYVMHSAFDDIDQALSVVHCNSSIHMTHKIMLLTIVGTDQIWTYRMMPSVSRTGEQSTFLT